MRPLLMLIGLWLFTAPCIAAELAKVRGKFKVVEVKSLGADNGFQVSWQNEDGKAKPQHILLTTEHVHLAVKAGAVFQIVAEVKADSTDIVQMLLLPSSSLLSSPVWLQSKIFPPSDLKAASYLEMHAPATDYMVL